MTDKQFQAEVDRLCTAAMVYVKTLFDPKSTVDDELIAKIGEAACNEIRAQANRGEWRELGVTTASEFATVKPDLQRYSLDTRAQRLSIPILFDGTPLYERLDAIKQGRKGN